MGCKVPHDVYATLYWQPDKESIEHDMHRLLERFGRVLL